MTTASRSSGQIVTPLALLGLLALLALVTARTGLFGAFLAADDFQWLAGGEALLRTGHLPLPVGDGFYRPLVVVWFSGQFAACGYSTFCYHTATFGIHLVNAALAFLIALAIARDRRAAWLAAALFAIHPANTQALAWISAATELLSATFFLLSLWLQLLSGQPRSSRSRTALQALAIVSFAGALLCHEAAITLPAISWLMWRTVRREPFPGERPLLAGLALVALLFGGLTVLSNARNPLFTNAGYRIGWHMVQHALDYVVGMYVGPGWWGAYLLCVVGSVAIALLMPTARFGVLWLWIAMLPFLGFTSGNVSRYSYLPSVGFALAVAAVAAALSGQIERTARRPWAGHAAFAVLGLFAVIRSANFYTASMKTQVAWLEEWRVGSQALQARAIRTADGSLRVAPDNDPALPTIFYQPILQWTNRDYATPIVTDR